MRRKKRENVYLVETLLKSRLLDVKRVLGLHVVHVDFLALQLSYGFATFLRDVLF